jgi:hypothetical protein
MERRIRRRKQLLDELKEKRGYWKLQEEPVDRTMRRPCFREGLCTCRKIDKIKNERMNERTKERKRESTR